MGIIGLIFGLVCLFLLFPIFVVCVIVMVYLLLLLSFSVISDAVYLAATDISDWIESKRKKGRNGSGKHIR